MTTWLTRKGKLFAPDTNASGPDWRRRPNPPMNQAVSSGRETFFGGRSFRMESSNPLSLVSNDVESAGSLTALLGQEAVQALLVLADRVASESVVAERKGGNPDLVALARKLYQVRRERDEIFAPELFSNPAWDILLASYWLPATGVDLTVGRLLLASARPKTTAWRWIERLIEAGLLAGQRSDIDRRSSNVSLTPTGRNKVEAFLQKIPNRHFCVGEALDQD